MLSGISGGKTLIDYFLIKFNSLKTIKQFEKEFIKLMKMMEPLFLGLKEMYRHGVIHNDIKYNNIVIHNGNFKYIDFGLANYIENKKHFKKRSSEESSTERIYIFYPMEYIFFYTNIFTLKLNLNNIKKRDNYNNYHELMRFFNKIPVLTVHKVMKSLLKKEINEEEMIKKIDVYSLGSLIPILLNISTIDINIIHKSNIAKKFFKLFQDMCEPLCSDRLNGQEAYEKYIQLINKLNRKKKTHRKKRK